MKATAFHFSSDLGFVTFSYVGRSRWASNWNDVTDLYRYFKWFTVGASRVNLNLTRALTIGNLTLRHSPLVSWFSIQIPARDVDRKRVFWTTAGFLRRTPNLYDRT